LLKTQPTLIAELRERLARRTDLRPSGDNPPAMMPQDQYVRSLALEILESGCQAFELARPEQQASLLEMNWHPWKQKTLLARSSPSKEAVSAYIVGGMAGQMPYMTNTSCRIHLEELQSF
jgi:hypothetical protein